MRQQKKHYLSTYHAWAEMQFLSPRTFMKVDPCFYWQIIRRQKLSFGNGSSCVGRNAISTPQGSCCVSKKNFSTHVFIAWAFMPTQHQNAWVKALLMDLCPQKNIDKGFAHAFLKIYRRIFVSAETQILVVIRKNTVLLS